MRRAIVVALLLGGVIVGYGSAFASHRGAWHGWTGGHACASSRAEAP